MKTSQTVVLSKVNGVPDYLQACCYVPPLGQNYLLSWCSIISDFGRPLTPAQLHIEAGIICTEECRSEGKLCTNTQISAHKSLWTSHPACYSMINHVQDLESASFVGWGYRERILLCAQQLYPITTHLDSLFPHVYGKVSQNLYLKLLTL